jgi:hypothetical protein
VAVPARPPSAGAAVRRAAPPASAVGIIRVDICVYIPIHISVCASLLPAIGTIIICTPPASTAQYTRARTSARCGSGVETRARASAALRRRRTGGGDECGAQQLRRVAGADRVRVEGRNVGADVVAAPRGGRGSHHERRIRGLARGGGGGAARRLGLDAHGARRALVAAGGAGDVRTCADIDIQV